MPRRLATASKIVDTIKTAVFPVDSTEMRSFLDACNVYRRLFQYFFKIARPVIDYLLEKI